MSIADHLAEGRTLAVKSGIKPRYAMLGPVKYRAWRAWVKNEVNNGVAFMQPCKGQHETFWRMIIVPVKTPGIVIAETCTP